MASNFQRSTCLCLSWVLRLKVCVTMPSCFYFFFVKWWYIKTVSLYSQGSPQTSNPPVSTLWVLGSQVCATMPTLRDMLINLGADGKGEKYCCFIWHVIPAGSESLCGSSQVTQTPSAFSGVISVCLVDQPADSVKGQEHKAHWHWEKSAAETVESDCFLSLWANGLE